MRAIGWNLNKVVQTGSNFGSNQQHENPLLCEIGTETMVSDGLFMINMHKSASAFRLEPTRSASATISATTSTSRRMDAPATMSCSAPK